MCACARGDAAAAPSQLQRLGAEGVDDMIQLDNLDEMMIMRNLQILYDLDNIYVRRGGRALTGPAPSTTLTEPACGRPRVRCPCRRRAS